MNGVNKLQTSGLLMFLAVSMSRNHALFSSFVEIPRKLPFSTTPPPPKHIIKLMLAFKLFCSSIRYQYRIILNMSPNDVSQVANALSSSGTPGSSSTPDGHHVSGTNSKPSSFTSLSENSATHLFTAPAQSVAATAASSASKRMPPPPRVVIPPKYFRDSSLGNHGQDLYTFLEQLANNYLGPQKPRWCMTKDGRGAFHSNDPHKIYQSYEQPSKDVYITLSVLALPDHLLTKVAP